VRGKSLEATSVEVSRGDENAERTRNQTRENEPKIDDPTAMKFSADVDTLVCAVSIPL
jgi:hypothetical protein